MPTGIYQRTPRHGHASRSGISPTYTSWVDMRTRCANPAHSAYRYYGAVGVTVCPQWSSFDCFLEDMGERPAGKTLDRKDNTKGYTPDNCRWATKQEQMRNQRTSVLITIDGVTLCTSEWARKVGLKIGTVTARIRNGWTPERALSTPPQGGGWTRKKVNQ